MAHGWPPPNVKALGKLQLETLTPASLRCACSDTYVYAGLGEVAGKAGNGAVQLLRRAPGPGDVLAQEALKLLAAFLRTCPAYQPSTAQVHDSNAARSFDYFGY